MLVQNVEALKKYYEGLLVYVNQQQYSEGKQENKFDIVETNGYKNINYNGKSVRCCLHSQFDPYNEAKRIMQHDSGDAEFDIIVGGGLYYHIEYAMQLSPGKKMIVIEPSIEVFKLALETRDISHLLTSEDLLFIVSDQVYDIIMILARILINEGVRLFDISYLISYRSVFSDFCSHLEVEIYNMIKTLRANIGTEYVHSRKWIMNTIRNLKSTNISSIPVANLYGKFNNKPALIVSAGPSLNKQLELIKFNADKFLIFASGSAVNVLEKNGITPHYMVAIDSEEAQDNIFKAIGSDKITLAYGHTLRYTSLDLFKGKKMWFKGNADPIIDYFEERFAFHTQALEIGPSCANEATDIARRLGCNPIVFVGQDLAYTGEALYSDGVVHDLNMLTDIGDRILTQDVYNNPIYTKTAFLVMKTYFENYIRLHPQTKYINCTEGGLNIQGMENIAFEEYLDKAALEKTNYFKQIDCFYLDELSCIENLNFKENIPKFLSELSDESMRLEVISNNRIERIGKLLNRVHEIDYKTGKNEMNEILKITEEIETSDIHKHFLSPIAAAYIMSVRQSTYRNIKDDSPIMERFEQLLLGIEKQYKFVHIMLKAINEALEHE